jgi:hypothetical protein
LPHLLLLSQLLQLLWRLHGTLHVLHQLPAPLPQLLLLFCFVCFSYVVQARFVMFLLLSALLLLCIVIKVVIQQPHTAIIILCLACTWQHAAGQAALLGRQVLPRLLTCKPTVGYLLTVV